MTAIDELVDLVRTTEQAASTAVVGIGRQGRGSGFVVAPGKVVTNAHNLRDQTTEVHFADGRVVQGTVAGQRPRRRPRRARRRHRRRRPAAVGRRRRSRPATSSSP